MSIESGMKSGKGTISDGVITWHTGYKGVGKYDFSIEELESILEFLKSDEFDNFSKNNKVEESDINSFTSSFKAKEDGSISAKIGGSSVLVNYTEIPKLKNILVKFQSKLDSFGV